MDGARHGIHPPRALFHPQPAKNRENQSDYNIIMLYLQNETLNYNIMDNSTAILDALQEIKRYTVLAAKTVLTVDDVCAFTGLSKNFIYQMTSQKKIPYYKPSTRVLYFDKKEVEEWMKQNRIMPRAEAETNVALADYVKG